jgi:flavin reductase (DIM6/NTAB) family NADH-FMN oxidoreductase RutF
MTGDLPADAFQQLTATLDYPMFVVTATANAERAGCLVGFATQCSINPLRLLVCISKRNHTFRVAAHAEMLAVHFLAAEDLQLARLFGQETGDATDKFAHCDWQPGPGGLPILTGCRGWVAGQVLERLDLGDHVGFLIEPLAGEARNTKPPQLRFQQVRDLQPGHEA